MKNILKFEVNAMLMEHKMKIWKEKYEKGSDKCKSYIHHGPI
jgi:CRISPR/Cas system-associated endonuclease Cas3-HD